MRLLGFVDQPRIGLGVRFVLKQRPVKMVLELLRQLSSSSMHRARGKWIARDSSC